MINFTDFFSDLGNDPESIEIVLMAYIEEYSETDVHLVQLYESQDWDSLYLIVHSLKGVLIGFGERDITVVLEEIERKAHAQLPIERELIDQVNLILPKLKDQILLEIEKVSSPNQ